MDNLLAQKVAKPMVINTRPVERAAPLTQCLQAAGFEVIDMPMLALQVRAITATDVDIMRAWLAGEYQALVIVSPTAAAAGLALWQSLVAQPKHNKANENLALASSRSSQDSDMVSSTDSSLRAYDSSNTEVNLDISNSQLSQLTAPSELIAVGMGTAEVLQQAHLAINSYQVRQPTIANNEGMLAMPEIDGLRAGDKLLVWRGLGGRRLLVDTLQARGVTIDSIAWYQRTIPNEAAANYLHWWQQHSLSQPAKPLLPVSAEYSPRTIVIISSGSAFENWQQVVSQAQLSSPDLAINSAKQLNSDLPKLTDFVYVVLGVRLAAMLAEQQLDYLQVEDLLPATIVAAIQHAD